MKRRKDLSLLLLFGMFIALPSSRTHSQEPKMPPPAASLELRDRAGGPVSALVDGDQVKLKLSLDRTADLAIAVAFTIGADGAVAARCIIPQGKQSCETDLTPALGWYWAKGGKGEPERELRAQSSDPGIPDTLKFKTAMKVRVAPRPVVLVHGLASNAATWESYTRQGGFLSSIGLRGFAVGDGQFDGAMFTGDPAQPVKQTWTIAQNAEILGRYIAAVKQATGARMVDLVAHSMGGLISRYYIDQLMTDRDVAQLVMMGSPHGGSGCASLLASLGFYLPATLELRPSYLGEVFNRQVTRRRGVPFYLMAGNPIVESFKAPCTDTPSDLVVSRASVAAVTATIVEQPVLHTGMTSSEPAFKSFVLPRLQTQAGGFPSEPDPELPKAAAAPVQFTQVFTGHVDPRATRDVTVHLDQVAVASFALYDSTRSLKVTVRGAGGGVIDLTPDQHGLIEVSDPSTMVTMGYGFQNPKPGPWKVRLEATPATPREGADYALSARVVGGAVLRARADRFVARAGQPIAIRASLELAQQPIPDAAVRAVVRGPDGKVEEIKFAGGGGEKTATWMPKEPGIYAIDVSATGRTPDGLRIERVEFLSAAVQPDPNRGLLSLVLLGIGALAVVTVIAFWLKQRFGRKVEREKLEL